MSWICSCDAENRVRENNGKRGEANNNWSNHDDTLNYSLSGAIIFRRFMKISNASR